MCYYSYMKKILLLVTSLFCLSGCIINTNNKNKSSSEEPTSVDYETFHKKALYASTFQNGCKKVIVNGDMKTETETYHFKNLTFDGFSNGRMDSTTLTQMMMNYMMQGERNKAVAITLCAYPAESIPNSKDTVYYIDGFKVESKKDDAYLSFNLSGLPLRYVCNGDAVGEVTFEWIYDTPFSF